jgi:hypothetical protein
MTSPTSPKPPKAMVQQMENQNKSDKISASYIHDKTINCLQVNINSRKIQVQTEAKYSWLYLDQKLPWQKHVRTKYQKLYLRLQEMSWLLDCKSKLSAENKFLLYECIRKPIWTYGIHLWGCTKPSNTKIIKIFQSKVLHLITGAPRYVSNLTLHNDLQIPFVIEEIHKLSTLYHEIVLRTITD